MFDTQVALTTWVESTVVLVVGSLLTWLVAQAARWLGTKLSVERMNELHEAAIWVVRYVEQEWQSGRIVKEMRLEEAIDALQLRVPWVTPELARQAVEAALRTIKESIGVVDVPPAPAQRK